MAFLFPAMGDASRDRALKGTPHTVYLWLAYNLLDFVEERAIKISGVATAIGIDDDTASKAVRVLVDHGYLVRSDGHRYRLALSRYPKSSV